MRIKQINKELTDGFCSCNMREITEAKLECVGGGIPREFFFQLLNHSQQHQNLNTSKMAKR